MASRSSRGTGDGALKEGSVAAAGAEEDDVELRAAQAEILPDALLVLLAEVEAQEDLAVPLDRQLGEEAADDLDLLLLEQGPQLSGRRIGWFPGGLDRCLPLRPLCRAPIVVGAQVLGQTAQEAGQAVRLPHLAVPDLLDREPEGLLEEVVRRIAVPGPAPEQKRDAFAVKLDQLRLGPAVPRLDAANQIARRHRRFHQRPPSLGE